MVEFGEEIHASARRNIIGCQDYAKCHVQKSFRQIEIDDLVEAAIRAAAQK